MAIASFDQYIAAAKQKVIFVKTATRTTVAGIFFSLWDLAGQPGSGVLAVGNTANGLVPTDATVGTPLINAFGGSKGYISIVEFGNTLPGRLLLYDRLFHAGAYTFNANITLATQPSFSSRVPGGTDYNGTEIWIECVTAFTGNQSIAVTYTNQAGVTGRSTGTIATGVAPTVGRMLQLPLQAGDTGVQKIESVVSTVSTVGTFNVLVLRQLWGGRVLFAGHGDTHGLDKTGLVEVFSDSALQVICAMDSTSSGTPDLFIEIANG
jgi:hypothetical protein